MKKRVAKIPVEKTEVLNNNPLVIRRPYHIDYRHTYGQDSPFFQGLAKGLLQGTRCTKCKYGYATPRMACMKCGAACRWVKLPKQGKVHSFTTCYYGSEEFLHETPYTLVLVEFEGFDSLLLSRFKGNDVKIGQTVVPKFRKKPLYKVTDVHFIPA